jgi:hypothetical protein
LVVVVGGGFGFACPGLVPVDGGFGLWPGLVAVGVVSEPALVVGLL